MLPRKWTPDIDPSIDTENLAWNREFGNYEQILQSPTIQSHPCKSILLFPEKDITVERRKPVHPALFVRIELSHKFKLIYIGRKESL